MAFTMSRGSPGTPPHTPGHGLPVSWHAVVPDYPFGGRVSHRIQRHLLSSLPAARAIHQCASWRTDYNGHYGIRELCDICPLAQVDRCAAAHTMPDQAAVRRVAARVPGTPDFDIVDISERAVVVRGLDEQPRYHLQHSLGFQIHDARHPHRQRRHGRAEIGWEATGSE